MADDELQFKIDGLTFELEEQAKQHKISLETWRQEAAKVKARLRNLSIANDTKLSGASAPKTSDVYARSVEWTIEDFVKSGKAETPKGESIWSPEFTIMGIPSMQIEFFPKGRDSTWQDGFCSLFFWCPAGIKVKYQLMVGKHWSAPDEDTCEARVGHGHSNLCALQPEIDTEKDSITLGICILDLRKVDTVSDCLKLITLTPESFIMKEADVLHNRDINSVDWRIKDIARRADELPCGASICSPSFSIAGVRGMFLEFYPNGVQGASTPGHCGYYVRCPTGTSMIMTLTIGTAVKGPIQTTFDNSTGKGLPDFCVLADQMTEKDLFVSIQVRNAKVEEDEKRVEMVL